jgi:hypothetical protein
VKVRNPYQSTCVLSRPFLRARALLKDVPKAPAIAMPRTSLTERAANHALQRGQQVFDGMSSDRPVADLPSLPRHYVINI